MSNNIRSVALYMSNNIRSVALTLQIATDRLRLLATTYLYFIRVAICRVRATDRLGLLAIITQVQICSS